MRWSNLLAGPLLDSGMDVRRGLRSTMSVDQEGRFRLVTPHVGTRVPVMPSRVRSAILTSERIGSHGISDRPSLPSRSDGAKADYGLLVSSMHGNKVACTAVRSGHERGKHFRGLTAVSSLARLSNKAR